MFGFLRRRKSKLDIENRVIKAEIARSKRFGLKFGILLLDVKHSVERGLSRLLPGQTISYRTLEKNLRSYDRVIITSFRRYYIILPHTEVEGISVVKARIYKVAEDNNWGDVSIGAAVYPEDGKSPKALLNRAAEGLR